MSTMLPADWAPIQYFRPEEFTRPEAMSRELIERLDIARSAAGIPFKITSSWREGPEPGEHDEGMGVDVRAHTSRDRYHIVRGALVAGFRRIGVYDRHVHLGVSPVHPSDVLWIGTSK